MRFREGHGHTVVSTDTAETIGRVDAYVVDPAARAVVALRLGKVRGDRAYLSWTDLRAFGPDAVTTDSADRLRDAAGESEEHAASSDLQLIGKLVLTNSGVALKRFGTRSSMAAGDDHRRRARGRGQHRRGADHRSRFVCARGRGRAVTGERDERDRAAAAAQAAATAAAECGGQGATLPDVSQRHRHNVSI